MIEVYGNWRWMRRRNRKYVNSRNQTLVMWGFPKRALPDNITATQHERYGDIHWHRRSKAYLQRTPEEDAAFYRRRLA